MTERNASKAPRRTIRDVAKAAGVSPSTVSRSLDRQQSSRISPETRRRVLEAARALNYRPDVIASGLRRQHTSTVGVLVPDLGNPIYSTFIRGISVRLEREGYTAILLETQDQHKRFQSGVDLLTDRNVDGLISAATRASDVRTLRALVRLKVPVVMAMRWIRGVDIPVVANDDLRGGAMAAEHLIQLGHRRVAQLPGPTDIEAFNERGLGFSSTLAHARLPDSPALDVGRLASVDSGRMLMRQLLATADEPPTAVFAHNDLMAIGAIGILEEANLRCPDDVSVIGYNDMPLTEHLSPPLSTIRMPTPDVGRVAAETLLGLIDGRDKSSSLSISLQPQLVVRRSTAPPHQTYRRQGDHRDPR